MADGKKDYASSGVDVDAADAWVEGLQRLTAGGAAAGAAAAFLAPPKDKIISGIGDYASVFALTDRQYVATSCDGVGTKLLWTLQGLGSAEALAQDLLAMNSNDLLCVGARPMLFLDYLAIGSKDLLKPGSVLARFMAGLNAACLGTGQLLVGGETAQMPDLYEPGHFDLAGFNVGFLEPEEYLSIDGTKPGDELWGWPSSGPHSNGFTLLRTLFDAKKDADFISKHLMAPTRLYVNEFLSLRADLKARGAARALKTAFHMTGSGLLNLLRAQPQGRSVGFVLDLPETGYPTWLNEVRARASMSVLEMARTFNMGWGFITVLDGSLGHDLKDLLHSKGMRRIGSVVERPTVEIPGATLS